MEGEQKPGNGIQEEKAIGFALLIFAATVFHQVTPEIKYFWHLHHFQLVASFTFFSLSLIAVLGTLGWNRYVDRCYLKSISSPDSTSIYLGTDEAGKKVHLKEAFRTSHTQVIGTTNAGKTESVILPWIIRDIENGSGLLVVDGKSDSSFLEKLYAYIAKNHRQKDFKLFSLVNQPESTPFNPLLGGTAEEASERVFSSFPIEHSHYRAIQSKIFLALVTLIMESKKVPTFSLIHRLLTEPEFLDLSLKDFSDGAIKRVLSNFLKQSERDRSEEVSGLEAHLSPFAYGSHADLFNTEKGGIRFDEVLEKNLICYFQLPTMLYPFLGEATGKLVLQSFQSAVAKRQVGLSQRGKFFSCYLDDFQDYIYRGFGALLNKSRSANVGVVFSHQALGDLDKVSEDFRNVVLTNTNLKVVMRNNDPVTCEYFAKSFGTRTVEKTTERRRKEFFTETNTGDGSVRSAEEYIYHPNEIRQLFRGQAIVTIPHPKGVKACKINLLRRPDLPAVPLPLVPKIKLEPVPIVKVESKTESPTRL